LGANVALGILDLSVTGACLRLKEAVPIGQELELHLESLHNSRPLKLPGQVIWCQAGPEGHFLAGVRFSRALPYADFQSLTSTEA